LLSFLVCLLSIVMAACGGSSGTTATTSNKAPDAKQVFRYPVVGDIATVDPALVEDTDSNFPIQAIYTGLVTLDVHLNVKLQLASTYSVSSDGMTYTFKLKPNLKFSDGTPLTSTDVIYSINRAVIPATNSPVSYYLSLIKDFDKVSTGKQASLIGDSLLAPAPDTVVIKISAPAAYFLQALSYPTSYVVEKKLIDTYGTKFTDHLDQGGGDGPFKVVSYSHTTGLQLVPNDNYYGPKPQLQHLNVVFYTDQDGMYKAYKANQLDYTYVPPANLSQESSNHEFRNTPELTIRYISMNYLAKPFDNIKIRQAFALALNKDLIVQTAFNNAFSASNHVIPKGMPGYNTSLTEPDGVQGTAGDPNKAKTLLQEGMKEAGYTTLPPITLTYYIRNQNFKNAMDEIVQRWQDILGVKVTVNTVARAALLSLEVATKNNAGPLQMWQAGWNADYPDPQDWLTTFFDKGSDYNQFNYGQNNTSAATEQQAVQVELEKADITQDPTARIKLYNDAEQKVINDVGWLPLWQEQTQSLVRSDVSGLVINAQQLIPPDDWSKIYITQ
jgi:oligopeptide transport system substrate-binding protein